MIGGWQTKTLSEVCQIKPPKSEARDRIPAKGLVSFLPMEDLGSQRRSERHLRASKDFSIKIPRDLTRAEPAALEPRGVSISPRCPYTPSLRNHACIAVSMRLR
jgi:hypothetical protein